MKESLLTIVASELNTSSNIIQPYYTFHKKCNIYIAQKSVTSVFSQCICVTTCINTSFTQMGIYIQCILCIVSTIFTNFSLLCVLKMTCEWQVRKVLQFSSVYTVVSCIIFLAIQYNVKLWITKLRDLLNFAFCNNNRENRNYFLL